MAETKPAAGSPLKGHVDGSWPGCKTCDGYGTITQELAIAGRGIKGDPCATCNGVGRVPDPSWPKDLSEGAVVSHGLGLLSPEKQASLAKEREHVAAEIAALQQRQRDLTDALKGTQAALQQRQRDLTDALKGTQAP